MNEFFRQYAERMDREWKPVPGMETGPVPPWTGRHVPDNAFPFPSNIFAPGEDTHSFAMWDWIYQHGISAHRESYLVSGTRQARSLQKVRNTNTAWTETVTKAHMSGDWSELDESTNPPLYSFQDEDAELLEAAHVLAHYRMEGEFLKTSKELELHGRLAEEYHKACGELMLSKLYGLPVDVLSRGRDISMSPYLTVSPCVQTGLVDDFPVLRMPVRNLLSRSVDRVLVRALVVLYLGQDPEDRVDCRERNKWAYRPVKGVFAGWETPAYLSTCPVIWPDRGYYDPDRRTGDFAAPVHDLLAPDRFREYLDYYKTRHFSVTHGGLLTFDNWITTHQYFERKAITPPMPCPYCLYTDNGFAEGLALPGWKRPDKLDKDALWQSYMKSFGVKLRYMRKALKTELLEARGRKTAFKEHITRLRANARRLKKW